MIRESRGLDGNCGATRYDDYLGHFYIFYEQLLFCNSHVIITSPTSAVIRPLFIFIAC